MDFGPKPGGFNILNVPYKAYKDMSPLQFWNEFNNPFLDAAIALARGDEFLFATRPEFSQLIRRTGGNQIGISGFGREYLYLRQAGYVFDGISNRMIRK